MTAVLYVPQWSEVQCIQSMLAARAVTWLCSSAYYQDLRRWTLARLYGEYGYGSTEPPPASPLSALAIGKEMIRRSDYELQ